jgi:hypothetical protein
VHLLWSQKIAAPLRGLAPAREPGWLLAWDADHSLHLFNRAGERQARARAPAPLAAACCADDGTSFAAAGADGRVWLLAPDLTPRWERPAPPRCTAVALDPFGRYLAAADAGGLNFFERDGRLRWRVETPRALEHLAFVPERPALAAAADFGLTACYDLTGRCLWRDGLVAHVGSLAVSGDGATLALACFSDGLYRYALDGPNRWQDADVGPCRLAALSYDGDVTLTAGLDHRLRLHAAGKASRAELELEGAPAAVALGPLGDYAVVALAEGKILGLATT